MKLIPIGTYRGVCVSVMTVPLDSQHRWIIRWVTQDGLRRGVCPCGATNEFAALKAGREFLERFAPELVTSAESADSIESAESPEKEVSDA